MIKYTSTHLVYINIYIKKYFKGFYNFIPIHIIRNILNEENIDVVIEEVVNSKNFQKSDTKIETYESIEEIKFPQVYEKNSIIFLDDFKSKRNGWSWSTSNVQKI